MTSSKITEAEAVQFPMVRHAAVVGWVPLEPSEATRLRGGETGMLFRDELVAALLRLNGWMDDSIARSVVQRLDALPPTVEGNRELLAWLRGERQWHDEAEQRHRSVQIIDFESPGANSFHVTWEWKLKPPSRKSSRADVVFVVNGVPVAIVEHKNPKTSDAIQQGIAQLKRYERETPELMAVPQLFNVTHLLEYWYGVTWNIARRYMARWKERPEDSYRFAVQSFFEPTDFLRTLQHWILFYVEDGATRKTVLRQHQREAAELVVQRCAESKRRRGLIWHTQGSGKTFTLLTAASLILQDRDHFRGATVMAVVDRTELEGQLKGWVEKLLGEAQQQGITVWQADSKSELQALLKAGRRGLIVTMIHKFEGIEANLDTRDEIYVFIDEAHRSVAGDLGNYLIGALPNATIIGFTGTPVDQTEHGRGTFKIFGADDDPSYLHRYTIAESIEDETTLPISYTAAPSEMLVPAEQLEKEFFELTKDEGVTDQGELGKVLDQAVNLKAFLTADDRIEKIAEFVATDFREKVEPLGYKAFLVGVNREACAKYKSALDELLPPEWSAAVYTEASDDSEERPLVAQHQLSSSAEEDVRRMFKKENENPKIIIVTDKLLTGYDAPLLYCMYLDKPMRDHALLQAIARVNRPHTSASGSRKRVGLIVDFVGVLRDLEAALRFDSSDVSGVIEDIDVLLNDFRNKIDKATEDYLANWRSGEDDEQIEKIVARFLDIEERKKFFEAYKEIESLWEILSPSAELRPHIDTFKQLASLYAVVRNAYADKINPMTDLANKTRRMIQESVIQEKLGSFVKSVTFDVDTFDRLRDESGTDEAKVFNLVRGFRQEVEDDSEMRPLLWPLKERAERIIKDLEERKTSGIKAMEQLELLLNEKLEAVNQQQESGLSPKAYRVHWDLKNDNTLKSAGISSMSIAEETEALIMQFPNATVNAEEERGLRAALYTPLLQLSAQDRESIVKNIMAILLDEAEDE